MLTALFLPIIKAWLIDDTKAAKRGKTMAALTKIYDPAEKRFVHGHILVQAAILFRGVTLPSSFEMWLPKKYGRDEKRKFRKLTTIAAALLGFDRRASDSVLHQLRQQLPLLIRITGNNCA